MIRLGTWRQNPDVPNAGIRNGFWAYYHDKLVVNGFIAGSGRFWGTVVVEGNGSLGAWATSPKWEWPIGGMAVVGDQLVSSGNAGSSTIYFFIYDDTVNGTWRRGPVLTSGNLGGETIKAVGTRLVGVSSSSLLTVFGHHNTPYRLSGWNGAGPVSPESQLDFADPSFAPTYVNQRRCVFLWGGMLWAGLGWDAGLVPNLDFRAAPIDEGAGLITGPWRTMGSLPDGVRYTSPIIWRGHLLLVGGSIDPADANNSDDKIWACRLDAQGLGTWKRIGTLPTTNRNSFLFVDKNDWLHIIGGCSNGNSVTAGPLLNSCYAVKLEEGA